MVVKHSPSAHKARGKFESSVISYGCQTITLLINRRFQFESSVISYGCQTRTILTAREETFESSVISYGCQTYFT